MSKKEEPIQSALFELNKVDEAFAFTTPPQQSVRLFEIPGTQILLGTSSFTAAGWGGSFYPIGMRSKDFLRHYSSQFLPGETKANKDMEGVAHTVEVTAESLYEAVAQGLAALRGREWVAGITHETVKVSVADVRVGFGGKEFGRFWECRIQTPTDST